MPVDRRDFDIVVLGATGFTGGLIAAYLAAHAPTSLRTALAGRTPSKLEEVRTRSGGGPNLVTVDATDGRALRALTARTRVLITTVGPYIVHGDPVVAACADTGTDYLDLTGESEFMDLTYLRHQARAVTTGARLVHACGFDSVPHDLGAQLAVEQLPTDVPLSVRGYVRIRGTVSGGTAASALEIMGRTRQARAAQEIRRQIEPDPEGRQVSVLTGRPGRDPDTGWWVVPMPTIDPLVVAESARQLPALRAGVLLRPFPGLREPADRRGDGRRRGRAVRRGEGRPVAEGGHSVPPTGHRTGSGAAGAGVVLRTHGRGGRRATRGVRGGGRRPRLHRDVEDDR